MTTQAARAADGRAAPRRRSAARALALTLGIVAVLVLLTAALLRFGVQTDAGRGLVMRLGSGVEIGPFGKLRLEGLTGDIWSDFRVARLTVADGKGVWVEGRRLHVRWRWRELLARRFHAQEIAADRLTVLRRPDVTPRPQQKPRPMPVSLKLDAVRLRLETRPAFSVRPGLFDMAADLDMARTGAAEGRIKADSLMHRGDGLSARFVFGEGRPTRVSADVVEAQGGALAGALGLPADRPLLAKATALGAPDGEAKIDLDTLSGDLHPLKLRGAWGKPGGRLNATVALAASSLTRGYADKVGPEVALALTARHDQGDLYAATLAADSKLARLRASGPIDAARQRTPGLTLSFALSAPNRLFPAPKLEALGGSGKMTGDVTAFRWEGQVDGRMLSEADYSLSRASGPLTLTWGKDGQQISTRLAGVGGGGRGLLAGLLGGAPRLALDGARLKDGRLLIRALKLDASGLNVDASGGQGLLGDLAFKGQAKVANLALLRPGAHGALQGNWSASQGKGAKAWDFAFDSRAANFASGFSEADRLLGPAPQLTAKGAYGPGGLQIGRADLVGAKAQVGAKGALSPQQALALTLDYKATGPFSAGPVEIAGKLQGAGSVGGTLSAPRADLKADLASIDFGRLVVSPAHLDLTFAANNGVFDGRAALAGPSPYGRATASAGFRFTGDGVELHDLLADAGGVKAQGSAALRNGAPSAADLTVAVGPGALLSAGRLSGSVKLKDAPGGAAATLAMDGQGISAPELPTRIKTVRFTAQGPLSRLPFQVSADSVDPFAWTLSGDGVFAQAKGATQVALSVGGKVRGVEVRTREPALIQVAGAERSARLRLLLAGGGADIDARQSGEDLSGKAVLTGVSLSALQEDYVGKVTGSLALSGRGPHLSGKLDAALDGARSRDAPANLALAAKIAATLEDRRLHVKAQATNAQGLQSAVDVDLPAEAAAQPFRIAIDRTKPLSGSFTADGEVRPLWDLFGGGDQTVAGRVSAKATISGTLNKPRALGQASLAGGKLTDSQTGLNLQNLAVQANFDQDAVDVRQFSGVDGRGGTLSGDGRVGLATGSGSTLALKLTRFQLLDSDLGRATASGALTVTRDPKGFAKLAGAITVDRAEIVPAGQSGVDIVSIDVVEVHQKEREGEQITRPKPTPAASPVTLDVQINAPRRVFIRGRGLDMELSLDAHVGGSTSRPELSGVARVVRGSYDFAGKRFDFDESGEVRLASAPEAIRLDLRAERQDTTLTAVVRVSGTAARPEVTLTSVPVLPQDEILSQVLFGRSAAQLSPGEAAQLASALASLSGGRGLDVIGGLRQFARLDRLAIGGDQTSGTTVSGGKYVTDNIYVELTGGARTGPSAQVEFRVRRNLSIVSSVAGQGDTRLSVRFRRSFK